MGADHGDQHATTRSGKFDISGKLNYLGKMTRADDDGSFINLKDDVGGGLEVGYNITEHINVSFESTFNSVGYDAVPALDEVTQASIFGNIVDITNYQINFTYFLLDSKLTPFFSTGLGWAYIESDVDRGRSDENCVRESSAVYVCDSHYDIDANFDFSYSAKTGFRWNLSKQMFIVGSLGKQWFDFDNAETAHSEVFQIQFGFYY
jgi:hypothetical protein